MKKTLIIVLNILILVVLLKYFLSSYNISYNIKEYTIKTTYNKKYYYFEIKDKKNNIYSFDIYDNRKLYKIKISKIEKIVGEDFECIYPVVNDFKTYPLCYKENILVDYNLIDSPLLSKYKNVEKNNEKDNDFIYFNSLDSNTYVALWNYKGYTIMNGKSYNKIELFKNDKYNNDLSYQLNNNIYMPNYDMEHEFNELVVLNIETLIKKTIKLEYNIDYDSYIVGSIKQKIYLFDNKHSILYEIDTKKEKIKIIGSNQKGYVMYKNDKFISCSKTLYTVKKIKYNDISSNSNYKYLFGDGTYKQYESNSKVKTKIFDNEINILKQYKDEIYYLDKDTLYLYNPLNGSKKVFYNYELEFNSNNTIFIYIK